MPSSSDETNLFLIFTRRLEQLGLTYMVTGSVAAIVYGEPRLTHDVDLVLRLETDLQAHELLDVFSPDEFYCAPFEVIQVEARRGQRGHFNVIHHETGFKADVYLSGRDALHAWGLAHRRRVDVGGDQLWVAPPEYVILRKLEYYREGGSHKHAEDIRGILRVTTVDRSEIEARLDTLGLRTQWQQIAGAGV
jgi:hypothetical protein